MGRVQKTEDRVQSSEDRVQRTEFRGQSSEVTESNESAMIRSSETMPKTSSFSRMVPRMEYEFWFRKDDAVNIELVKVTASGFDEAEAIEAAKRSVEAKYPECRIEYSQKFRII